MRGVKGLIRDFVKVAKQNEPMNGLIYAQLPEDEAKKIGVQPLKATAKVLAQYWDELGNQVVLTLDKKVLQLI